MDYEKRAEELFREGYNCAQAVFLAFACEKMDRDEAARLASAFGGGLAGTRNTCGAVSGLAMAYGLLRGYADPTDKEAKRAEYEAVREMTYGGETFDASFPVDVYKTADDAGEFTYFLFRDDTMQTTWHIEFRYGSDLDQLLKYMEGPYAYWLSAGIDADASPETIDSVIDLFVSENLGGEE